MRFSHPIAAYTLSLLLLVGAASAQTSPDNGELITMNMRDADIRTLIQWVADQTGKNMVVHRDVQGKVTVLSAKPVTKDEAYAVFLSVLQVHGFAAIESPEAVKIVPSNIAAQSGVPVRSRGSDDMGVQVFKANNVGANELAQRLRPLASKDAVINADSSSNLLLSADHANNVGANELAQMLRPLASKDAVINADSSSNMLLIADHANNVEQLQSLVQKLDRAGSSEVELIPLKFANAKQVLASLTTLFPQGG